jgi:hypothetical protein
MPLPERLACFDLTGRSRHIYRTCKLTTMDISLETLPRQMSAFQSHPLGKAWGGPSLRRVNMMSRTESLIVFCQHLRPATRSAPHHPPTYLSQAHITHVLRKLYKGTAAGPYADITNVQKARPQEDRNAEESRATNVTGDGSIKEPPNANHPYPTFL